jgi:hypothetical protein
VSSRNSRKDALILIKFSTGDPFSPSSTRLFYAVYKRTLEVSMYGFELLEAVAEAARQGTYAVSSLPNSFLSIQHIKRSQVLTSEMTELNKLDVSHH